MILDAAPAARPVFPRFSWIVRLIHALGMALDKSPIYGAIKGKFVLTGTNNDQS